jgi:hypothetical protein
MGFTGTGPSAYNQLSLVEVGEAKAVADPEGRKAVDHRRFLSPDQAPIRARSIRPAHPMGVEAAVRNRASFAYPNPVVAP